MTIYYYRKGVMVGMKRQFETDYEPPKNCIEEKVLDEVSYNSHIKHYQQEQKRLQDEFRVDLLEDYNMTHHPKANQLFDKAWDFGSSAGLWEVEDYFVSLIELLDDTSVCDEYGVVIGTESIEDEKHIDRRQNKERRVSSVTHEAEDFIIGKYYYV